MKLSRHSKKENLLNKPKGIVSVDLNEIPRGDVEDVMYNLTPSLTQLQI
jgi:hypothetical protein